MAELQKWKEEQQKLAEKVHNLICYLNYIFI